MEKIFKEKELNLYTFVKEKDLGWLRLYSAEERRVKMEERHVGIVVEKIVRENTNIFYVLSNGKKIKVEKF